MYIQIRRISVTAKELPQQEQTFFLQCSSLFLRESVFSLLNKKSMRLLRRFETGMWKRKPKLEAEAMEAENFCGSGSESWKR